ncbi:MAG: hypoxanthine phosphoribosyltransferase [Pseudomonadota bacterium]
MVKDVTVMLSAEEIERRVRQLGREISEDYAGRQLVLVGILRGAFMFLADLARHISIPAEFDFLGVVSYGDATSSSGVVRMTSDLSRPIEGKHVLIVEDIVDTGLTAQYLMDNLRTRRPATLEMCALLEKPMNNQGGVPIRHLGFTIPNQFVVGYGMDHAGMYRNLPYLGILESHE